MDGAAHQLHFYWSRDPRPLDLERDRRSGLSAQRLGCLFARPSLCRLPHYLCYPVARLETRPLRGTTRKRCDHDQPAITQVGLEAKPRVVTRCRFVEPSEPIRRKKGRIRIPQLVEHSVHRLLVQRRVADGVDVLVLHAPEHVVEELSALVRSESPGARAVLQEPATGNEGAEESAGDDCSPRTRGCAG